MAAIGRMLHMNDKPKISVAVITYNQEDTIRQTLDSILMQKGDFELEVVVGEDCSSDHTWDICNKYATKYPDIVRLLPNTHNLGITANYFRVLKACTGEFIADIAGDDFYCDEYAFEKQMQYMQKHPKVGLMAPNGYSFYVRRNIKILGRNQLVAKIPAKDFFFNENYSGGVIVQGSGVMFRTSLLQYIDYDEIIRRHLPVEDYPMQAIWSQYTQFAWLPDPIVTYRVYKESATFISFDSPKYLSYHKGLMDTRRYLNELFPQDACFSEEWMQDYEFYKEYLLYLHKFQYKKAKELITKHSSLQGGAGERLLQAKRMTSNWFRFIAFALYKEWTYFKDIKNRT